MSIKSLKYVVFDKESGEYICGPLNKKDISGYIKGLLTGYGSYRLEELEVFGVLPVILDISKEPTDKPYKVTIKSKGG